jgi:hypothetical protein
MENVIDYPHLISLILIVGVSTLIAGLWAERRRGQLFAPHNVFVELILTLAFILFYTLVAFLLPAIIVTSIIWEITSLPETTPDIVLGETVAQIATLFSVGANFADIASTYGRVRFFRHLKQYSIFVIPIYYSTIGLAYVVVLVFTLIGWYQPIDTMRVWKLFTLPLLAPQRGLNLLLCISVLLGVGVVSFFLRKRGEER